MSATCYSEILSDFFQVDIVQFLIKAAADITLKDCFQNTCLNDAVRCRSLQRD